MFGQLIYQSLPDGLAAERIPMSVLAERELDAPVTGDAVLSRPLAQADPEEPR